MKIALCMIVKNEAKIINRCLMSVAPLIDYVYIEDTGSTDNTVKVTRDHLEASNLPGHVHEVEWKDFAHNRSEALRRCRKIPGIDYILMVDADEIFVYEPQTVKKIGELKEKLVEDCYYVLTKMGGITYRRPQLTKASKPFHYKGVVHEFLACDEEFTNGEINGFFNKPIQDSARNNDPKKYEKDALALEKALEDEKDEKMIARYKFYCAQSWRDAKNTRKALFYYEQAAEVCTWNQEKYYSLYKGAMMKKELGYPAQEVLVMLMRAFDVLSRGEVLYAAMRLCRENDWWTLDRALSLMVNDKEVLKRNGDLFHENWVYDYGLFDEMALAAFYNSRFKEAFDLWTKIIKDKKYPETWEKRLQENLKYAKDKL